MGQVPLIASAVTLSQPGRYLHWSIFTVSVANLAIIAVMVVIFGLALLLPFPKGRHGEVLPADQSGDGPVAPQPPADPVDAAMWTFRIRRRALSALPPEKLLPDRQPAYVSSWVYVFGVASLAALGLAIFSGFLIALGGPDWWHTTSVGHFFNSMHMWSVELFMAFMVIHLWGKFWMAAWRGRRAATWITGVVAFMASVVECFTGYLSQQNFDSQWISTSGKDAFNAAGVGSFFNPMNFGQMLLWHVVFIPVVLVAHRGRPRPAGAGPRRVAPLPGRAGPGPGGPPGGRGGGRRRVEGAKAPLRHREGGDRRHRDRLGPGGPAGRPPLLPRRPVGHHLDVGQARPRRLPGHDRHGAGRTSETATYGPPYNNQTGSTQTLLLLAGKDHRGPPAHHAAETFVLTPLTKIAPTDPAAAAGPGRYEAATAAHARSGTRRT